MISISGWYDGMVGIEGETLPLVDFLARIGVSTKDLMRIANDLAARRPAEATVSAPYWSNGVATLYHADARDIPLPDRSVHCAIMSPPYWALRNYGLGEWVGGDNPQCQHTIRGEGSPRQTISGSAAYSDNTLSQHAGHCPKCGADFISDGIGLEPSIDEWLANIVAVLREVHRVLRDDGSVWLNLGDAYVGSGKGMHADGSHSDGDKQATNLGSIGVTPITRGKRVERGAGSGRWGLGDAAVPGLQSKNLMFQPHRVAMALQQPWLTCRECEATHHQSAYGRWPDGRLICPECLGSAGVMVETPGWIARQTNHWIKSNPMPSSARDRTTEAVEYVFHLTKQARYFYDSFALRNEAVSDRIGAYERMQQVPPDVARNGIPDQTQRPEQGASMPPMHQQAHGGMEGSKPGTKQSDGCEISQQSARGCETGSLPSVGCEQKGTEEVPTIRQGQSIAETPPPISEAQNILGQISSNGQIQAKPETVSRHAEGSSKSGQGSAQAADDTSGTIKPDGSRVGGDLRSAQPPLPLLQTSETVDYGSSDAPEQGRGTRQGEYRSGVSELQFPKGQSDNTSSIAGRNLRNAWVIPTQGRKDKHYASFPDRLPELCILAGTSEHGVCSDCGAPWVRQTSKTFESLGSHRTGIAGGTGVSQEWAGTTNGHTHTQTLGWQPTCECGADTVPATVLDCFVGRGTTSIVAQRLGRRSVGLDLNVSYLELARKNIEQVPLPMLGL